MSGCNSAFRSAALDYHRQPTPGKLAVVPTKGLSNQRDLALAYSPGVAFACEEIVRDPLTVRELTARGNLVAVVTNGTAVLGLGDIGPLAAKPVMEGKACLFKKFAGIDVFDIEIDARDPERVVEIVAALEPTVGGVNLEDIKAPECFYIERELRRRMRIPVFHDDQHGTAIIASAALLNGLLWVGKRIEEVKLVCSGAGAAAIACLDLMCRLGLRRENVFVVDSRGVIYEGRDQPMEPNKARYAQRTTARTLAEVIEGADVFLGLSQGGVLQPEMVARMAAKPLIFALANPVPEIMPEVARAVRPDAIVATGRSDYPNQVNNVLCFPFIFRGALDVGATAITEEMKLACVEAIAALARAESNEVVASAYGGEMLHFGPEYLIPKPFDPRLIVTIAPAVARAAIASGVATRPIADFETYRSQLQDFVYRSGVVMKPVFSAARSAAEERKRVVFCEGEDERVLRAAREVLEEGIARPILVGRPQVIEMRLERIGLSLQPGRDFELVNPESDSRYRALWQQYHRIMARRGITPEVAKARLRRDTTLIGCMLLINGEADAVVCGTFGSYEYHLQHVHDVVGLAEGASLFAAMNLVMTGGYTLALADTYVNYDPSAEEVAEIARMAAEAIARFGIEPRVALVSHSSFGSANTPSARKMRTARAILRARCPSLEMDGEMHADAALSPAVRARLIMPEECTLQGDANVLVMPNVDAANIAFNLVKQVSGQGVSVGPILLGARLPVQILTPSASVRRLVNMTALAVVEAKERRG
ncbi:MAG: NADP-dependent malic enzyme [Hydrogenophilus sp.]|nr:NADP-dependent malic enzyme [Hydrogenophilus sp.]